MIRWLFRNRWVRRIGLSLLGVVLLAALLCLNTYFSLRNRGVEHRDHELAALDAADPTWRWDALSAARTALPPAEENIAERACKIADRFPPDWSKWNQSPGPPYPTAQVGGRPSDEELAQARKLVGMCRELVADARGVAKVERRRGGHHPEHQPDHHPAAAPGQNCGGWARCCNRMPW